MIREIAIVTLLSLSACAVGDRDRGGVAEVDATASASADVADAARADAEDAAPSGPPACDTTAPVDRDRYAARYREVVEAQSVRPCTACGAAQCCYELVACLDF